MRLRSSTNTQGMPFDRLTILPSQNSSMHVSSINFSLRENGMNSLTSTSFTAFIGIDWADTKHDVCLQASNNDKREFAVIPHQADRIEQWAHAVHKRFGGTIAIAIELAKGPIVYALQKYFFCAISNQSVDAGKISRNF
jgi:hypothetical protein